MLALAHALNGNSRRLPAGVVPDAESTAEPGLIAFGQRWLISPVASVLNGSSPADRRHSCQTGVVRRRQQNRVVCQPRFAAGCPGIGDGHRRATVERNFISLPAAKTQSGARRVRKGVGRILRPRQGTDSKRSSARRLQSNCLVNPAHIRDMSRVQATARPTSLVPVRLWCRLAGSRRCVPPLLACVLGRSPGGPKQ